ncbi:MAG: HPr kinase/phosphatase C-terminal domain-containing protein [Alphaproteobacteria bacterium]|nr:HPr kinase/phosphatase C-terminal domain-containing protein [Alphaproteobacteria bacterium]
MSQNIHATCINLNSKGILLLGDSGAGKSDLALRLITLFSASLVSDDRTDVVRISDKIKAKAPDVLKGLLEVRGVGIVNFEYMEETTVDVVIKLEPEKQERLPEKQYYELEGIKLPLFKINPFEVSAPSKVLSILRLL